ncbi:MAG: peptidyl-tRNA hydrolase [Candidatus Harrisonbacteria bacterium]|nr:peptidyl-tRNA hydrolase [Candidatus Harrisonbacteria bacterium]
MTQTEKPKDIKLIIGLGNPGMKYENTYHNVGVLFIDSLKDKKDRKILRSSVYMNESGAFVKNELKKHKVKPSELLIVHDESDIELGKVKLSFDRGAAGHNGVQDIIDKLKTKAFWRLRLGIRPISPLGKERPKADKFVLKPISATNKTVLKKIFALEEAKLFS